MFDLTGFTTGVAAFALAFAAAGLFTGLFKFIYQLVTPYNERALIRQGNIAAAIALAGAILGYVMPLVSALNHTVSLVEFCAWALVSGGVQILVFTLVRLVLLPDVKARIEDGQIAAAIYLATLSLAVGLLNAACMSA
ncbi:DUF350 domain-containing protein [Caulobacter segnis]|uniref:DUF350 domain-containing protein n=1 Tax=Caulobacter segnis TaxID=88688 RepID=UPI0024109FCD|nr:DUF350 domain-containing protein [Caulobacter segnis]MDG2520556.1 DUF350 domain-containing protein [Caulobacter segnis]